MWAMPLTYLNDFSHVKLQYLPPEDSNTYASSSGTPKCLLLSLYAPFTSHVHGLLRASYHLFAKAASKCLRWSHTTAGAIIRNTQVYDDGMSEDNSSDTARDSDASTASTVWSDEDEDEVESMLLETFPENPDILPSSEFIHGFQRDCLCDRVSGRSGTNYIPSAQLSPHMMDRADGDHFVGLIQPAILNCPIIPMSFEIDGSPGSKIALPVRYDCSQKPHESTLDVNGDIPLTPFDPVDGVLLSDHYCPKWRHYLFKTHISSTASSCRSLQAGEMILESRVQMRYMDEHLREERVEKKNLRLPGELEGVRTHYGERRFC
jgi:hypothetical protein